MPEMRAGRTGAHKTGREVEAGGRREGMGGGGRFSSGGCGVGEVWKELGKAGGFRQAVGALGNI